MVLGVPGERGGRKGFLWGWGMGAGAAQVHMSSSQALRRHLHTKQTDIPAYAELTHWVETENNGLNEGRGLPE